MPAQQMDNALVIDQIKPDAQFIAVCRRSKMVAMGTRSPRRGSRLCRRWALKWREDGQLLGPCLRATKCDKLSGVVYLARLRSAAWPGVPGAPPKRGRPGQG